MQNIVIYGAGNYGSKCIDLLKRINRGNILAFIDLNKAKIGTKLMDIPILSFEESRHLAYDSLIVAVKDSGAIIRQLWAEEGSLDRLYVYDGTNDRIQYLKNCWSDIYSKDLQVERAVEQIQDGLLMECFGKSGVELIQRVFVTAPEYIETVKRFFSYANPFTEVTEYSENSVIDNNDRILICDEDYMETAGNIRNNTNVISLCCFVPLYDVKNKLVVRR